MPSTNAPAHSAPAAPLPAPGFALRVGAALVGGALLGLWSRREPRSRAARVAGALLAGYALRPAASRALTSAGLDRQRVRVHLDLNVARPVHEMFTFFHDFENFPQIIHQLHAVEDYQDGRSHWEVRAANGELFAWDAVVTKYLPNSVIAWHSVPGSAVESHGMVRFSPHAEGGTHLEITLEYCPLHTSVGAAVRSLVATPPSRAIEAELAASPTYLESIPKPEPPALD